MDAAERITIQVKRVYSPPDKHDGYRILVDRLWPRGVKKTGFGYRLLDERNGTIHSIEEVV